MKKLALLILICTAQVYAAGDAAYEGLIAAKNKVEAKGEAAKRYKAMWEAVLANNEASIKAFSWDNKDFNKNIQAMIKAEEQFYEKNPKDALESHMSEALATALKVNAKAPPAKGAIRISLDLLAKPATREIYFYSLQAPIAELLKKDAKTLTHTLLELMQEDGYKGTNYLVVLSKALLEEENKEVSAELKDPMTDAIGIITTKYKEAERERNKALLKQLDVAKPIMYNTMPFGFWDALKKDVHTGK